MTEFQEKAISMIESQQAKVKDRSNERLVGEQLKDICRAEPHSAELIAQDLENEGMSITGAEKKIAAFAKKNGGRVSGVEADQILREFYGLPAAGAPSPAPVPEQPDGNVLHLEDFF